MNVTTTAEPTLLNSFHALLNDGTSSPRALWAPIERMPLVNTLAKAHPCADFNTADLHHSSTFFVRDTRRFLSAITSVAVRAIVIARIRQRTNHFSGGESMARTEISSAAG